MIGKVICWTKGQIHAIIHLEDDKKSIAAGVAIGVFWGFTPFFGFKTILTFLTAWACRVNKVAAVAAVALHELLLPIYPFYLHASYQFGSWLLHTPQPLRAEKMLHILHHPSLWKQEAYHLWPVLLGSVLLAVLPAILAYVLTLWGIEQKLERAAKKKEDEDLSN
ncbi:MAG: DUF2062 domain-containing protein [Verrucomicrobium sp.]|nr:DUF2062 domain-containing protein [Verrucomicrobium sp.]